MTTHKTITVIDETIREGMQHLGVMFSLQQRKMIVDFQEKLGVDVCQAGYPSAHPVEARIVTQLCGHARKEILQTRIAAMGRATRQDISTLLDTGAKDLHLHVHIKNNLSGTTLDKALEKIISTVRTAQKNTPGIVISVALLDIGRSDLNLLRTCVDALDSPDIDILSLPDTSGMMAPNQIHNTISKLSNSLNHSVIAVHCHNDLGMANANSLMGILAGGRVLEATALGIGERNGLADLFVTARHLRDQGFDLRVNTDDVGTFEDYYTYVDGIVFEQTGHHLLTVNTPVFGEAVKTHVAGTHAGGEYGLAQEENIFLNVLCSRRLVKKFLDLHRIACPENHLEDLTRKIKDISMVQNKAVSPSQVKEMISDIHQG